MSLEETEEQIERYYISMENELLLNIARKLKQGKPMEIDKFDTEKGEPIIGSGGVNEWQLQKLKEFKGLTDQNAKIIAKYSGKTLKEVKNVFARAKEIGTTSDKQIIDKGIEAGILHKIDSKEEKKKVRDILDLSIKEVLSTFNKQNNSLLASAGNNYTKIINQVSSQVIAGTKTLNKAMQEAVSELAKKGLTGFTARNGAEWTPEAYTKMILRANVNNAINDMQDERLKLAGNDYIEISSHSGARPKCADDQGQIFSLSGNTDPIEDLNGKKIKVRAWSSSSYGKPDGILGINCGHSKHAFVPGLSIYREEKIKRAENDEEYLEKQQQRLYERSIRNKKREIAMLKEIGADATYVKGKSEQLSYYRKEYLEFLEKTGRTRVSANEWIGSSEMSSGKKEKSIKQYDFWKKEVDKKVQKSIIGEFDITKFDSTIKTITKDVVLLEERIDHIKGRHPEVVKHIKDIPNIIKDPDMILKELKREDTIWVIKEIDKNIKITIKLNTSNEKRIKNSIIQMQYINSDKLEKYVKNGKVDLLFEKVGKK